MEVGLDGTDRVPQLGGDLGDGQAITVESQEDVALDRPELLQAVLDVLAQSRVRSSWSRQRLGAVAETLGIGIGTLVPIDPHSPSNLPKPAADRLRRVVGGTVSPGASQDVLQDIVGFGAGQASQPRAQRGHLGDQTARELVGPVHGLHFGHV